MRKIIIAIVIAFGLFAAYSSKPDDKTCIIAGVRAVWGDRVPDEKLPMYFNQFMDITSQSVRVNDWIFLKRIQYKFKNEYKTVGFGAFKKVYTF
ncbi:hypothetical protein [Segetibacter koreensis]|uniref:hypothetical protein n=1 Tax=Segetibacter koreensis TaxID=398037 RepID=UPI00037E98B3|nr:hypothetical protein [Segetibacter koreensis]